MLSTTLGTMAANVVDGTANLAADAVYHSGEASKAFVSGYKAQHAKNLELRAQKLAMRGYAVQGA